jgi:hypothetical protein
MKITILTLIVLFIFLGISLKLDMDQRKLIQSEYIKAKYNEIMFTATEDASFAMLKPDSVISENQYRIGYDNSAMALNPNLDKALSTFYGTLYANMGLSNDPVGQDALKMFVPVKMVTMVSSPTHGKRCLIQ